MKPTLRYKKLSPSALVPAYGTASAAGADLYALPEGDTVIAAGETKIIHTGIAVEIPEGYMGLIFARSGLATKCGLAPANKVGVIDADYRGELMVALYNQSGAEQTVAAGERIAQLIITPFLAVNFEECDELSDTERGVGGFGSTGAK